jgi:hypothetical protein
MAVALTEAIEDGGNSRMIQLRKRVSFAMEVFDRTGAFFRIGKAVEDLFYCATAVGQALVVGDIDEPHAAAGEEALDAVSSREKRSGLELSIFVTRHGDIPHYS